MLILWLTQTDMYCVPFYLTSVGVEVDTVAVPANQACKSMQKGCLGNEKRVLPQNPNTTIIQ